MSDDLSAPTPRPRPVAPELPVTFRPRRTRIVLLSAGAALLVTFTVIALSLPGGGRTGWHLGDRITFIGCGLAVFALLAFLSRPRVTADTAGVTVVNLTTTRRLEWPEVLGVHLRPGDPWVYLDLADGTSLAAMGIQPGVARAQAVRDARALRTLAERHGTGPAA